MKETLEAQEGCVAVIGVLAVVGEKIVGEYLGNV